MYVVVISRKKREKKETPWICIQQNDWQSASVCIFPFCLASISKSSWFSSSTQPMWFMYLFVFIFIIFEIIELIFVFFQKSVLFVYTFEPFACKLNIWHDVKWLFRFVFVVLISFTWLPLSSPSFIIIICFISLFMIYC